jgi:hypothetical protein
VNTSTNNVGCEKLEEVNLVSRDRRKDGRRKKEKEGEQI